MNKIFILFFLIGNMSAVALFSLTVSGEDALRAVECIEHQMSRVYAPGKWKELNNEPSYKEELEQLKIFFSSQSEVPLKEAQGKVLQFIRGLNDHHANLYFYSTESAKLPITVKGANQKYFITTVNLNQMTEEHHPIHIGDELLTFNGKSINDLMLELKEALNINTQELTDQSMCETFLTSKCAYALASSIPEGVAYLTLRSKEDGHIYGVELAWDYQPEEIVCGSFPPSVPSSLSSHIFDKERLSNQMLHPYFFISEKRGMNRNHAELIGANPNAQGRKRSHLPLFGHILWETERSNPFHAYIFQANSGKNIGYLRISRFSVPNEERYLEALKEIIAHLENETEMLIIDQLNNPGGNLFYLYAVASLLTEMPLKTPLLRRCITYRDVYYAVRELSYLNLIRSNKEATRVYGKYVCGFPVSYQLIQHIKNYQRFILKESKMGKSLSGPNHVWGVNSINPHATVRYTKKILMLINELDFSCGDFFPWIMRKNGRATLFGCQTAGAGGSVEYFTFPNVLGISELSLTTSVFEGIEGKGVLPDIEYKVSEEDIQTGYQSYKKAVLEVVGEMLKEPLNLQTEKKTDTLVPDEVDGWTHRQIGSSYWSSLIFSDSCFFLSISESSNWACC